MLLTGLLSVTPFIRLAADCRAITLLLVLVGWFNVAVTLLLRYHWLAPPVG